MVIDPGDEPDRILEIIRGNGLHVTEIVHTHAHLDHVMGTFEVAEATGAAARLHEGDRHLWERIDELADTLSIPPPRMPPLENTLRDGDMISIGSLQIRVIHTPGHTRGSCCLALTRNDGGRLLFSGDTLFRGKIGIASAYPDKASNLNMLITSIHQRLLTFDDDTLVIPGHGGNTHIGAERRSNPFLRK